MSDTIGKGICRVVRGVETEKVLVEVEGQRSHVTPEEYVDNGYHPRLDSLPECDG